MDKSSINFSVNPDDSEKEILEKLLQIEVFTSTSQKQNEEEAIALLQRLRKSDCDEEKQEINAELNDSINIIRKIRGLDTNYQFGIGLPQFYRSMGLKMVSDLKTQYNCVSPKDKAMVQIGVAAFCRYLHFNDLLSNYEGGNAQFVTTTSKELDKAFRQYNSVATYLNNKKYGGQMNVKLTANTAFIAQNQQNIAGSIDTKTINDEQ